MTLGEAVEYFASTPPKGEFVLVLAGEEPKAPETFTLEDAVSRAKAYLEEGKKPTEAAKLAAKECGFSKSDIYKNLV